MVLVLVLVISLFSSAAFADQYIVQSGDTLSGIATEHGVDLKTLIEANSITNPNMIYPGQAINISKGKRIDILTTNDFHGNLVGGYEAGAAKLAAYMEYYKSMNPDGTIILDGGDSFQGTPMSNLLNGAPVVQMMNTVGYSATTVGNHEFDWGIQTVINTMEEEMATYPMLTANVWEGNNFADWSKPYTLVEMDGITIGILGLSTPDTAVTAHKDYVGTYEFKDPAMIAEMYLPVMEAEGADLVIVLSHLPAYQNSDTGEVSGELADLAASVDGYDAFIGGHSHARVTGMINDTPVVMAYKNGRMIGHITLYYDEVTDTVLDSEVTLHEVRKAELPIDPDVGMQSMVDGYNAELLPIFGVVLGSFTEDLIRDYNLTSAPGNWFTDVMREFEGADVAFTNAGGIRVDITAGDVTMEKIYEIMPFDNTTVTTTMTGADILDVLEQGCTLSKGMIQISGLDFTYDSTMPEYERVIDVTMMDGSPLDLEEEYLVVTNDFLAGGQDNYVTLGNFSWQNDYELLRDMLADDLESMGTITPDNTLRAVDISQ
jgi:2',3'-cyclic-nucleotide 2'-phosphodiesterase/3'-nucleotidase